VSYEIKIRPDAVSDIEEAATWHEEREPGLEEELVRAIREAINKLPANPVNDSIRKSRGQEPADITAVVAKTVISVGARC